MRRIIGLAIVMAVMAGGVQTSAGESSTAPSSSYEDYKIVYEKNIFSRLRYTPPAQSREAGGTRKETVVLSLYVLRGVAVETQNRLAFIEDEISGQSRRLTVGDMILEGTITEIYPDRVVFRENDQSRDIRIGQEFDRLESVVERPIAGSAESPTQTAPASSAAPAKSSAPASSADEADVLKKLLERRKQEMGN
jgi:type II secretory pathway component PulC